MINLYFIFLIFFFFFTIIIIFGWRIKGKASFRANYELIILQVVARACVCVYARRVSNHPGQPIEVSGSIIKACHWPEPESGQPITVAGARSGWECVGDSVGQKRQLWPFGKVQTVEFIGEFPCNSLTVQVREQPDWARELHLWHFGHWKALFSFHVALVFTSYASHSVTDLVSGCGLCTM